MKPTIIIPSYNFKKGVDWNLNFIDICYDILFKDFNCIVVDNMSDEVEDIFELTEQFDWCDFKINKTKGSLKNSLLIGYEYAKANNSDAIQIIETDAVMNLNSLKAMINIFEEEKENNLASVTPMYKWNDKYCYPTHNHWHTDPIYKQHDKYGLIRETAAGVPFLCSFWNIDMFKYMPEVSKEFMSCDGEFGQLVYKKGFKHLRACDHDIQHYMRGKNSNNIF